MIRKAPEGEWQRFTANVSEGYVVGAPILPTAAPYRGVLPSASDYVLPDDVLSCVRDWLYERGDGQVLYFLTETAPSQGEDGSFVVDAWDLNADSLSEVNSGFESVLTGIGFDWALFVNHEGRVHVAGPSDLFDRLVRCTRDERG